VCVYHRFLIQNCATHWQFIGNFLLLMVDFMFLRYLCSTQDKNVVHARDDADVAACSCCSTSYRQKILKKVRIYTEKLTFLNGAWHLKS